MYGCVTTISFLFITSDITGEYAKLGILIKLPSIEPVKALLVVCKRYEVGCLKSDKNSPVLGAIGVPDTKPVFDTFENPAENIGLTISVISTFGLL